MSQDGDHLFGSSEGLLMSDFSSLTEFDSFRKDLFLGITMEEITEEGMLEELDCKDELKLISEVNDVFEASMNARIDDGKDLMKAQDSSFALLDDSGSFISSQLDLQTVSAELDDGSTHITSSSSVEATVQSNLPSPAGLVAANELSCMPLAELEQLRPAHESDNMCAFSSPLDLMRGVSLANSTTELHLSSVAPSSPLTKDVGASMFTIDARAQSSDDMMTLPVQKRALCRSLSLTFCKSDLSFPSNLPFSQSINVHSNQGITTCGVYGESMPEVSSLQRSQSSNSLGHPSMSDCGGVCADDVQIQPLSKQEVPLLPTTTGVGYFPLSPYQASAIQGLVPMRRVYSTGDLQVFKGMQTFYGIKAEDAIPEDTIGMKIGHYTMEERKMKLHRYRQKRTERNFSKKIKYACRKTLADNRPRVRGRFARSDEMGDSGLKGTELPLIDEYEAVTSHRLYPQVARDQQSYLVVNNSCIMPGTQIAQFWTTMGMKVAM